MLLAAPTLLGEHLRVHVGATDLLGELVGSVLDDHRPLIHKASGWMLREVGVKEKIDPRRAGPVAESVSHHGRSE